MARPRYRDPPGLQSRHRARRHRPRYRFSRGHACSPGRWWRPCASRASPDLYASGSGVYGDLGEREVAEDHGPLLPISTYGASKLSGEALIACYCFMFGLSGCAFRFGNVVGPRQTHGVGFDFVRQLLRDPARAAHPGRRYARASPTFTWKTWLTPCCWRTRKRRRPYEVYNVATGDYITVTEIARLAASVMGLDPDGVRFVYSGGDRGWKGDVPIVRLEYGPHSRARLALLPRLGAGAAGFHGGPGSGRAG